MLEMTIDFIAVIIMYVATAIFAYTLFIIGGVLFVIHVKNKLSDYNKTKKKVEHVR